MNFIDHSSDPIRQIVPQDFSFLSDADLAITAALQAALDRAAGVSGGTFIISGCSFTPDPTDEDYGTYTVTLSGGQFSQTASLRNSIGSSTATYTYHIADGTLLHGGKLYQFTGGDFQYGRKEQHTFFPSMSSGSYTVKQGYIAFDSQVVSPSPVYGEDLTLCENPHHSLVASIAQGTKTVTPSSISGGLDNPQISEGTVTHAVTGNPSDYVAIGDLLVIPQLATFPFLQ